MEFLLMAPPQGDAPPTTFLDIFWLFFAIFFIFWILVIRPQRKQERALHDKLQNLKKGEQVITRGGIIGKVVQIKDDRITLKVDESTNSKITFLRSAVMNVIPQEKKSK